MREIKRIVLFIAVFAMIVGILSQVVRPKGYEVYHFPAVYDVLEAVESEKENTLDVLIAGDSLSKYGLNPLFIFENEGITSFNLSSSGQRICDTYAILTQVLSKQSPKVILLETGVIFSVGSLYNYKSRELAFVEKYIPLVHYHGFYKNLLKHNESSKGSFKGYSENTKIKPYKGNTLYMNPIEYSDDDIISDENLYYLNLIRDLCKEKSIDLVLISIPSPVTWNFNHHRYTDFWAQTHGIRYMDLNLSVDSLRISWERDTFDAGDHLNKSGAEKVSNYIASFLKNEYHLMDRRGHKDMLDWMGRN